MSKKQKWEIFQAAAVEAYDALTPLSPGVASFYSAFGFSDINVLEVDQMPSLASFFGDELTLDQQKMVGAASVLATRINQLVKIYFTRKLNDQGSQNDEGETFIDSDFPGGLDQEYAHTGLYGTSPSENDSWHEKVGGPLAKSLLEDIKVILENPLVSAPSEYAGTFFQNTFDIEFFTSGPQFSDLSGKLSGLLDAASEGPFQQTAT